MRRAGLLLVVALLAIPLAYLAIAERTTPPAIEPEPAQPVAVPAPAAVNEPSKKRARLPVRLVAPEMVAPPPLDPASLERTEPRDPLGPHGRALRRADLPPRETLLHRPFVVAAGVFHSKGHVVALAGIKATDVDEICTADGQSWPCGIVARTAFRNWLRGRSLACVVPSLPGVERVVTDCHLGGQDAATWLVAYGWVRALPDGPHAAAAARARESGLGLFGTPP